MAPVNEFSPDRTLLSWKVSLHTDTEEAEQRQSSWAHWGELRLVGGSWQGEVQEAQWVIGAQRYSPSWLVTSITALIKVNRPIKGCGWADKLQCDSACVREDAGIHSDSRLPATETWLGGMEHLAFQMSWGGIYGGIPQWAQVPRVTLTVPSGRYGGTGSVEPASYHKYLSGWALCHSAWDEERQRPVKLQRRQQTLTSRGWILDTVLTEDVIEKKNKIFSLSTL